MQFNRVGEFLGVARITGPHHNLLQLRLGEGIAPVPVLECLPAIGKCTHTPLNTDKLVAAVIEGISSANKEFGTNHTATHIRYVRNDTPPEEVYGFLAFSIVRHLESNGF